MKAISNESAKVSEYPMGDDFTAVFYDFGSRVECWIRKGITQQLYFTGEKDIDREVLVSTIGKILPTIKDSWPLMERDDGLLGSPEGERVFPIREVKNQRNDGK